MNLWRRKPLAGSGGIHLHRHTAGPCTDRDRRVLSPEWSPAVTPTRTERWRLHVRSRHDQARHGADYIRIYVTRQGFNPLTQKPRWADMELRKDTGRILPGVGQPSTDPALNGVSISTTVSAPGRTGRHIVYVIWQASHADQSYYFCSDVIFPGGAQRE